MKVLLTANSTWNAWHFRRPVIEALLARGDRVAVLAPPDSTVGELVGVGVEHVALDMDVRGLNPVNGLALRIRLERHFRDQAPDVILSWTIKNNLFGAMAARRLGVPFIPNVSGLGTAFLSGGLLRFLAERLYMRAFRGLETVFFQNHEDRRMFIERRLVRAVQAAILPGSGIDLVHFAPAPLPEGPPSFLMIARLLRDKGVLEYVEAARRIGARHPEIRFRLLGAADSANRTAIDRQTVAGWERAGVIDYLGTTDDVRPAIAAAQCIVLPSYREGAPRTLIEGAAMARPVIATDVPGCRDVVSDGQTGLLCQPRDAASLSDACERFLALPVAARAAMGASGRQKMEAEFDQRRVVEAYLAAIDRAIARAIARAIERA